MTGRLFDMGIFKMPQLVASIIYVLTLVLMAECRTFWHFLLCQGFAGGVRIFMCCISRYTYWHCTSPPPNCLSHQRHSRPTLSVCMFASILQILADIRLFSMRLVSMSCDPNSTFTIDGHNMTIIEVDSVNTQALTVDSIQIFAGQRYSFVVCAHRLFS